MIFLATPTVKIIIKVNLLIFKAFSGTICEKTTNQSDYIPKYVKKTIPFKESEKVVKSSAPLNDKSTHQYDFTKKKVLMNNSKNF